MSMAKKMLTVFTSLAVLASLSAVWLPASADAPSPAPWMLYTFNGSNGDDTGAAANNAAAHGPPEFGTKSGTEAGPEGKYLVVNSDSNYLTAPGSAFDFGTTAFTVSFWVRFAADYPNNLGERVFQTGLWGDGDTGFVIAVNRDGGGNASICAAVAGTGPNGDFAGTWGATSFAGDFFDGAWHLITVVFEQPGKQYTLYLDSAQVGVKTYTRDNLSADTNRSHVGIGAFYDEGSNSLIMRPTYCLDDVAFYKSALTANQIAAYYASPAPSTVSGSLTIGGTAKSGQTLTVDLSALIPQPAAGTYDFQWQASATMNGVYSDISGATGASFTLTNDEVNTYVRVVATPATGSPYTNVLTSPPTPLVGSDYTMPEPSQVTLSGTLVPTYTIIVPSGNHDAITSPDQLAIGAVSCTAKRLDLNGTLTITASSERAITRNGGTETIGYALHTKDNDSDVFTGYQVTSTSTDTPRELAVTFDSAQWNTAVPGTYSGIITFTVAYAQS